jgi:eukaryotic-like serine/threonine-protein kinase
LKRLAEICVRDGVDFVSREAVDAPRLAVALGRGPLPVDDALRYAVEIGGALARGLTAGRIHGGLCPEAIAITAAGARLLEAPPQTTGPYRAPEQVAGSPADARTDVWALGALLYAMLSGVAPPWNGEQQETAFPEGKVPALHGEAEVAGPLIAACVAPEPAARRQRIQNVVSELRFLRVGVRTRAKAGAPKTAGSRKGRPFRWLWLAVPAALALAAAAGGALLRHAPSLPPTVLRFDVPAPANTSRVSFPAVSPDGSRLTFAASTAGGRRTLWVRPLGAFESKAIQGTEEASAPFWSPDSRSIAFFANRMLRRVNADGSGMRTICPAEAGGGGTWSRDGTIVFAAGLDGGLSRVPAEGGNPEPVLPAKGAQALLWPQFLPDGKHFLFFLSGAAAGETGVYAGALGSLETKFLFASETNAVYAPPAAGHAEAQGYLASIEGRTLIARKFDPAKMVASVDAIVFAEGVPAIGSLFLAPLSVSENGTLVYQVTGPPSRELQWLDSEGREIAPAMEGDWGSPRFQAGGRRAVAAKLPPGSGRAQLWVVDEGGGAAMLPGEAHVGSPVWSPDGGRIAFFAASKDGYFDLQVRGAAGGKPEPLFSNTLPKYATDWSRDGRYLLFNCVSPATESDIWLYVAAERRAGPLIETVNQEGYAVFSPDGKWVAYQSGEASGSKVLVQAFNGPASAPGKMVEVAANGGLPHWRADGRELFYMTPGGQLMAAAVEQGDELKVGPPRRIVQRQALPRSWNFYDVSEDGSRIVLTAPVEWNGAATVRVAANWWHELKP